MTKTTNIRKYFNNRAKERRLKWATKKILLHNGKEFVLVKKCEKAI